MGRFICSGRVSMRFQGSVLPNSKRYATTELQMVFSGRQVSQGSHWECLSGTHVTIGTIATWLRDYQLHYNKNDWVMLSFWRHQLSKIRLYSSIWDSLAWTHLGPQHPWISLLWATYMYHLVIKQSLWVQGRFFAPKYLLSKAWEDKVGLNSALGCKGESLLIFHILLHRTHKHKWSRIGP